MHGLNPEQYKTQTVNNIPFKRATGLSWFPSMYFFLEIWDVQHSDCEHILKNMALYVS